MKKPTPTRTLREHPDLDQLRRQAKELLEAFVAGVPEVVAEVNAQYFGANPSKFALHDAQLVIARAYGFESWPKLKAHVDGVTVKRLEEAARSGDLEQVRAMLRVRPELAQMGAALHYAVIARQSEMARVLLECGASARDGVYPHRDATSPLTIAVERGYDEIVTIIKQEEQHGRDRKSGVTGVPAPEELFRAIAAGDAERSIAMLESAPELIRTCHSLFGWTPLHIAARTLNVRLVEWLLDRGAVAGARGWHDLAPLDMAAHSSADDTRDRFGAVARLLISRGAEMSAAAAAALGDADWLRNRHAEGRLTNPIETPEDC